jgi:outer membrane lipoprotein-sorting protein
MPFHSIRRRLFAAVLALAAFWSLPAPAALPPEDGQIVQRVQGYLNGISTLQAKFQQIAPDGSLSTGTVYIRRPGQLRFDYDPPSKVLLIATDWRLIFYDGSIRQVNTIPLSQTPLAFLLASEIKLDGDVQVTRITRRAGEIDVTVVRRAEPDQGSVTLTFADAPLELRRWAVTDAQGLTTHIVLQNIVRGQRLASDLFFWRDPQLFGYPD